MIIVYKKDYTSYAVFEAGQKELLIKVCSLIVEQGPDMAANRLYNIIAGLGPRPNLLEALGLYAALGSDVKTSAE